MRLLAIDAAQGGLAVGIFDRSAPLAVRRRAAGHGNADIIVSLIAEIAAEAGVPLASIERVGVTVGPGSFTGVRVGIAAARGFALGAGIASVGVASLPCFAAPYIAAGESSQILAVALDARHGNAFAQAFNASGVSIFGPCFMPVAKLAAALPMQPVLAIGTAAAQLVSDLWTIGGRARLASAAPDPDLAWVARLAAAAPEGAAPRPLYLKAPDAVPAGMQRLQA